MGFPESPFVIHHCKEDYGDDNNDISKKVLDDKDMSTEPGNPIIDWPYNSNSNQLWSFEDGRLKNVYSGFYLTFKNLQSECLATQEEYDDRGEGQKFNYDDDTTTISLVDHDDLVVGAWDNDVKIAGPDQGDPARHWDFTPPTN